MTQISNKHVIEPLGGISTIGDQQEYRHGANLLDAFESCAERYGGKIAVDFQGETLTYSALLQQSNQLANALSQQGVGPNSTVSLCLERGLDAVLGLLAILRIGATYIPLDPSYPQDRLAFMLSESQPDIVLTDSLIQLPDHQARSIYLDQERAAIQAYPTTLQVQPENPAALAYIMYTSGSTGKPKGVQMPRSSVAFYLKAIGDVLAIQPDDIYLHVASFSFSSSIRQLLVPLSQGATVILASQQQAKNPMVLLELMQEKGITVSDTVASVWRSVLQAVKSLDNSRRKDLLTNALRLILLSGDITACSVLQHVRQQLSNRPKVVNIYGQTETIGVCAYPVPDDFDRTEGYVPVGFPYEHNRIYVLDEDMRPVPQGEIGELHVAGGCLAQGYLHRPEKTAMQFVQNPWVNEVNRKSEAHTSTDFSRLYKTGDLARQLPDGCLEMRGRADFQVKLRGMRVELGEIERTIERCAIAKEAIVLAKEDQQGEKRLVAYVVPQTHSASLPQREFAAQVRKTLKETLPDYLVPALIVSLEALPLTPNGKRDRLSLPEPDWSSLSTSSATSAEPADEVESALQSIWTALFGFTPGLEDSYFDLGGHSLMAVQLFAQMDQQFGCKLSFNHLLDHPTIKAMAAYIRAGHRQDKSAIIVALRPEGSRPPLFCVHGIGGAAVYYRSMLPFLPPDQPLYGVQSCGFDGIDAPLRQVEDMAELYIKEIRKIYPEGPLYLLGHSFGGLVVYEMARQLEQQGDRPALVAVVDTKTPMLAKTKPSLVRLVKTIGKNLWTMPPAESKCYLVDSAQWYYKKRKVVQDREYAESLKRKNAHIPMMNVLEPNYKAQESYTPGPYGGDLIVFRASTQSPRSAHQWNLGWEELIQGNIGVYPIFGTHEGIMKEPNVGPLAYSLIQYLGEAAPGK
ncbi:MAG: amino acid adenylation domain-containing protein [Elainellaceae cyanobacterium]